MSTSTCTIYLVRHGESEYNRDKIVSGHGNPPLTEKGRQEAREAKRELENLGVRIDEVYSSPLDRAVETAEIISGRTVPESHKDAGLMERNFGAMEGKHHDDLAEHRENLRTLPHEKAWIYKHVPDMESDHELSVRAIEALLKIAKQNLGKTLLVTAHSGTVRTTTMSLKSLTNNDFPVGSVRNAGWVRLTCDGAKLSVEEIKA
jgi:broad specificity phosphatase PhoE